jgi:ribosome-binding factor A
MTTQKTTQRTVRVNTLIKRELNTILRARFRAEAVYISVTRVAIAPDLRQARVFFSVFGGPAQERQALHFLNKHKAILKGALGQHVTLKYMPDLVFAPDIDPCREDRVLHTLDQLAAEPLQQDKPLPQSDPV